MRRLTICCVVLAAVLGFARFCTGLVYGEDEAATYLVLKAPGWSYHRQATEADPIHRRWILDEDEPALAYEGVYLSCMCMAPWIAGALAAAAIAGLSRQRRAAQG